MKLFHKAKDGGPDSNVTGYWFIESKRFFSIALLCFDKGSREAYHNHAFNAWSWILKGELEEHVKEPWGEYIAVLKPRFKPLFTSRERLHQVFGVADKTWALTFRGPWKDVWNEWFPKTGKVVNLTHGRKVIDQ